MSKQTIKSLSKENGDLQKKLGAYMAFTEIIIIALGGIEETQKEVQELWKNINKQSV